MIKTIKKAMHLKCIAKSNFHSLICYFSFLFTLFSPLLQRKNLVLTMVNNPQSYKINFKKQPR
jgi:hypothetical protein